MTQFSNVQITQWKRYTTSALECLFMRPKKLHNSNMKQQFDNLKPKTHQKRRRKKKDLITNKTSAPTWSALVRRLKMRVLVTRPLKWAVVICFPFCSDEVVTINHQQHHQHHHYLAASVSSPSGLTGTPAFLQLTTGIGSPLLRLNNIIQDECSTSNV